MPGLIEYLFIALLVTPSSNGKVIKNVRLHVERMDEQTCLDMKKKDPTRRECIPVQKLWTDPRKPAQ